MLNWTNTKTTLELNDLLESGCDPWAFEYPSFYKGGEKQAFEQKVLDHYRFRQIGQETPGRWLHYFRTRMREIMPYYIQLYESQALMQSIDDPFGNVDVTETFEQTRNDSSEATTNNEQVTNTTNDKTRKFSNTPQGAISNLDDYMTEATLESDVDMTDVNGQTTTQGSESGTIRHTLTRKGNQGVNTYAHDMTELRSTFLNIDLMIIHELNDLFLMVY